MGVADGEKRNEPANERGRATAAAVARGRGKKPTRMATWFGSHCQWGGQLMIDTVTYETIRVRRGTTSLE